MIDQNTNRNFLSSSDNNSKHLFWPILHWHVTKPGENGSTLSFLLPIFPDSGNASLVISQSSRLSSWFRWKIKAFDLVRWSRSRTLFVVLVFNLSKMHNLLTVWWILCFFYWNFMFNELGEFWCPDGVFTCMNAVEFGFFSTWTNC